MLDDMPLSLEMLSELRELLAENFNELIDRYLADSNTRFDLLENAIGVLDFKTIQYQAHGIKGSSRNMGANPLAKILDKIEALGGAQDIQNLANLFEAAKTEYARVATALEDYRVA